jgi:hypothetical protein
MIILRHILAETASLIERRNISTYVRKYRSKRKKTSGQVVTGFDIGVFRISLTDAFPRSRAPISVLMSH